MANFKVTGIDQSEDPVIHFTLFSESDPTSFEEAVKDEKWQKAMKKWQQLIEMTLGS